MRKSHAISLPEAGVLGAQIMQWSEEHALFSEPGPGVTRRFGSDEHRKVYDALTGWMQMAGLSVELDAVGNLVGRRKGAEQGAATLVTGSHQDTVRQGGRYDGMLGILTPLACMDYLNRQKLDLPYDFEMIAFGDEEGLRFQTTLFGSRAVAGGFTFDDLARTDADGISLGDAIDTFGGNSRKIADIQRPPGAISGYIEVHIEQGPVLESKNLPIGVVTGIAGCNRFFIDIEGKAGHAGTVPMAQRCDAFMAAAEVSLAIEAIAKTEKSDAVATVGMLTVTPNAINVIPGTARLSVDLRAGDDTLRQHLVGRVEDACRKICNARRVDCAIDPVYSANACQSSPRISELFANAIAGEGIEPFHLVSGAGHDAMAFAPVTDIGMLFVRCKDGLSHHPDESITTLDADAGARVLLRFLQSYKAL